MGKMDDPINKLVPTTVSPSINFEFTALSPSIYRIPSHTHMYKYFHLDLPHPFSFSCLLSHMHIHTPPTKKWQITAAALGDLRTRGERVLFKLRGWNRSARLDVFFLRLCDPTAQFLFVHARNLLVVFPFVFCVE